MEPTNNFAPQVPPQEPVMPPPQPVSPPVAPPVVPPPAPVTPVPPPPPAPTPSVPPSPSRDNSWKTFFFILLGMIVLGVLAYGAISYMQRNISQPLAVGEEYLDEGEYKGGAADDPYQLDREGVFSYPDYNISFVVPEEVRGGGIAGSYDSSDNWTLHFNSESTLLESFQSPDSRRVYDVAFYRATSSLIDTYSYGSGTKKTINGIEYRMGAYNRVFGNNQIESTVDIYETLYGGLYYVFLALSDDKKDNVPILEKMLSTLKFTN